MLLNTEDVAHTNSKVTLGDAVPTWTAYDRETGAAVLVDDRTFDAERHSKEPMGKPLFE